MTRRLRQPHIVSLCAAVCLALFATGCVNVQLLLPLGPEGERAVAKAQKLVNSDRHLEAITTLETALKTESPWEDELLYRLGVILVTPEVADHDRAREVFRQLLTEHPDSPRRLSAEALTTVLNRLSAVETDLKQIVDIDVEAERQRQREPADTP